MIAPRQAVDCHAHIIDPERFPFDDGPGYMPQSHELGPHETYAELLDRRRVGHALLVQPSCYGFDNTAMLDAVARDPGRYKAIAMVDAETSEKELRELGRHGVVGVRFNLPSYDRTALSRPGTLRFLQRLRALGWFAEVFADDEQWPRIVDALLESGVQVVVDHFGIRNSAAGIGKPGFAAVLALGRTGRSVVKLTTPFVFPDAPARAKDLKPVVASLISAFGVDRCVWGSDWPFLGVRDRPDYAEAEASLSDWVSDPVVRNRILWDNPLRLFGWSAAT